MPVHPLLLFLPLLAFIPPSGACRTAGYTECLKAPFVPGHNLVGEGFDIVKMETTGATVVDIKTFMVGDGQAGNCTLCQNGLLNQEQKLPVSVLDWRVKVLCRRSLSSKMFESSTSVMRENSQSTSNSWQTSLGMKGLGGFAVGGSHSKSSKFAQSHSTKDKYSFTSHSFKCQYYTFRLHNRPPLSKEFEDSLRNLPTTRGHNSSAYNHFLSVYGTHFIRRVHLGGRVDSTTAIRTCEAAMNGFSMHSVSDCLSAEASGTIKGVTVGASAKFCKDKVKKLKRGQSFSAAFSDRLTEVLGGNGEVADLLFNPGKKSVYKPWLKSLKKLPGLVSYQLSSLHMLVRNNPAVRQGLRSAIRNYIKRSAVPLACPSVCAMGRRNGNCACRCKGHKNVDENCCPGKPGVARMTVTVIRASGLWGDYFSKTDGYVKVFYGSQGHTTGIIWNNDFPYWNFKINYGTVDLQSRKPVVFEVWDRDNKWNDDLLGRRSVIPTKGQNAKKTFRLKHGTLYVSLSVDCGPSLKGSLCCQYAASPGAAAAASGLGYDGARGKDPKTPVLLQGPHTVHNNMFL